MIERIAVLGEVLWDVFASGERIGGAAFNFAAQLRRMGHHPLLVTAIGEDERGARTLDAMEGMGLDTGMVKSIPDAATGSVTVEVNREGQPDYKLHRPAAWDMIELQPHDLSILEQFQPSWVYFGTLQNSYPLSRHSNLRVLDTLDEADCIYDLNLRKDSFTPGLVWDLMGRADIVKMNADEVAWAAETFGIGAKSLEDFARGLTDRTACHTVLLTLGEGGSAMFSRHNSAEEFTRCRAYRVTVADTVGAGDAFTAAAVNGLALGWPAGRVLDFANRLGARVASRPGGTPEWSIGELEQMKEQYEHSSMA